MSTNSRRSFVWKMGAGVSAALVPAVSSAAGAQPGTTDDPALRAALLEEEKAIRQLHQAFEQAQDKDLHDDIIGMFAEDAEVIFNGGVFRTRGHGVSRFYRECFRAGKSGRRMEPPPGVELAADQRRETVQVAPDRLRS